jgi:6-hydroxymethylpterin diphosphokinase MptE-like
MDSPRRIETGSGATLEYQGRLLYSRTQPERRCVRVAAALSLQPDTLYLLPSPLLLYGVRELIGKLPPSSFLLALESDYSLSRLTEEALENRPADPSRFRFLPAPSAFDLQALVRQLPGWPYRRVDQIVLNGGFALNRGRYEEYRESLDRQIRISYQDRITLIFLARRWMKNLFTNLTLDSPPAPFRELRTALPLVVAGAGESLEKSIEELRRVRSSIYLLAADTALPALAASGLTPDAVVVLEAQFINMRDFYGTATQQIDLIADLSSYPAVFRLPWRRRYAFYSRFAPLKFLDKRIEPLLGGYSLQPYGSVGITAAALGTSISGGKIYLTGIDFCYRFGKSHARGTQFIASELAVSDRLHPAGSYLPFMRRPLLRATGKDGKRDGILSDLILLNYSTSLKDIASAEKRFFDLNPGGLDLGAPHRSRIEKEDDAAEGGKAEGASGLSSTDGMLLMREELSYLERLYSEGAAFLAGASAGHSMTMIEEHDYLYAHFPEELSRFPREPSYMKRLLLSVDGYRDFIAGKVTC